MTRFSIIMICLFMSALTISSFAQNTDQRGQHGEHRRGGRGLKQLDTNNDGKISREEWKGHAEIFDKIDKNKDGFITGEELAVARQERGAEALKQMDANNDGKISREEWKGNPERFSRLDANNDGFITSDEIKAHRPRGPRN